MRFHCPLAELTFESILTGRANVQLLRFFISISFGMEIPANIHCVPLTDAVFCFEASDLGSLFAAFSFALFDLHIWVCTICLCTINMTHLAYYYYYIPPDKSAYLKIIFLFFNQNICCGYSKEPSQLDGSFEHTKHMFKLMD